MQKYISLIQMAPKNQEPTWGLISVTSFSVFREATLRAATLHSALAAPCE